MPGQAGAARGSAVNAGATPRGGSYVQLRDVDCCFKLGGSGLVPLFFFFLRRHVKLDGIETDDFPLRAAIITLYKIAFISIFVHLNLGLAFGARSSWHRFYPSVIVARDLHHGALVVAT